MMKLNSKGNKFLVIGFARLDLKPMVKESKLIFYFAQLKMISLLI